MSSAGEGGAWGIALLAAFMGRSDKTETLTGFLGGRVFAGMSGSTVSPQQRDIDGINAYMKSYRCGLAAEKAAAAF